MFRVLGARTIPAELREDERLLHRTLLISRL